MTVDKRMNLAGHGMAEAMNVNTMTCGGCRARAQLAGGHTPSGWARVGQEWRIWFCPTCLSATYFGDEPICPAASLQHVATKLPGVLADAQAIATTLAALVAAMNVAKGDD